MARADVVDLTGDHPGADIYKASLLRRELDQQEKELELRKLQILQEIQKLEARRQERVADAGKLIYDYVDRFGSIDENSLGALLGIAKNAGLGAEALEFLNQLGESVRQQGAPVDVTRKQAEAQLAQTQADALSRILRGKELTASDTDQAVQQPTVPQQGAAQPSQGADQQSLSSLMQALSQGRGSEVLQAALSQTGFRPKSVNIGGVTLVNPAEEARSKLLDIAAQQASKSEFSPDIISARRMWESYKQDLDRLSERFGTSQALTELGTVPGRAKAFLLRTIPGLGSEEDKRAAAEFASMKRLAKAQATRIAKAAEGSGRLSDQDVQRFVSIYPTPDMPKPVQDLYRSGIDRILGVISDLEIPAYKAKDLASSVIGELSRTGKVAQSLYESLDPIVRDPAIKAYIKLVESGIAPHQARIIVETKVVPRLRARLGGTR